MSLNRNIYHSLYTQIPSVFFSLVAGVFITRLLGPEGKGVFSVYFANIEILVLLFSFGTEQGIVYFISNNKIDEQKVQTIALTVVLLSIFLNSIIIFTIKSDIIYLAKYDDLFFKLFLLLAFAINFCNSIMIAFLKAKKEFQKINKVVLFSTILNLTLFFSFYILVNIGLISSSVKTIFTISSAVIVTNFIIYIALFLKINHFSPKLKISLKGDILPFYRFSFVGFLGMLVNFLNYRLDIWFVSYYQGTIQLGLYALAVNFAQFVMMLSKTISSVMMPYLSEDNTIYRREIFKLYSRLNFTAIFLISIFLYFTGEYLLILLYGKEFAGSSAPFQILIIGMLFTGPSQLFSSYLSASNRNDLCLYTNIVGLTFTVILDIVLIPKFGIIGSAYATLLSYMSIYFVYIGILVFKDNFNLIEITMLKINDLKSILHKNELDNKSE